MIIEIRNIFTQHKCPNMILKAICGISFWSLFVIHFVDGACTLPTELSGDWLDSRVDVTVRFQSLSVISGWTIQVNQENAVTFSCVESDDSRWVFRSDQLIYYFGPDYYAIYCYEYTKLTDYSYSYYVLSDVETVTSSRVFMVSQSDEATFTSIDQYCTGRPDPREFHVLVKKGFQQNAHVGQYFPKSLLGVFSYTIDDGSGSIGCSSGSLWDSCYLAGSLDRTTASLNYSVCNIELMNATTGVMYHVANVEHSSTDYVMLMTLDGSTTYFTCIAVTESGFTRIMSTHPERCVPNQVSNKRVDCNDCRLLSLTVQETCLLPTTTEMTTAAGGTSTSAGGVSTNTIGRSTTTIVIAILSLLLFIIIIITVTCLVYHKYIKPKKKLSQDPVSVHQPSGLEPDSDLQGSGSGDQTRPRKVPDVDNNWGRIRETQIAITSKITMNPEQPNGVTNRNLDPLPIQPHPMTYFTIGGTQKLRPLPPITRQFNSN